MIKQTNYDRRVLVVLKELSCGRSREEIAKEFKMTNWRSLDTYMRRRNFRWDGKNKRYVPASKKDIVLKETDQNQKRFDEVWSFLKMQTVIFDPKLLARKLGFNDHRELGLFMDEHGLKWNSDKQVYVWKNTPEEYEINKKAVEKEPYIVPQDGSILSEYEPMLQFLKTHQERLEHLLTSAELFSNKGKNRYSDVTTDISDELMIALDKLSKSWNCSKKSIVEKALLDYLTIHIRL